jgi:caffeoyl-CoA O-methyltransferase
MAARILRLHLFGYPRGVVSTSSIGLSPAVSDYLVRVSVREHPVLAALREETASHPLSRMQISPEQGRFMALLVELIGARRTLEIGVFTGYSALSVALALPADGKVVACDVNAEWTTIARRYWQQAGVSDRIELALAPAAHTLDRLIAEGQAGSFDFSFIDADKEGYDGYYERSLVLVRSGGVIAIDNALWSGDVADDSVQDADTRALRALNEKVGRDERVSASLVPIGDGLWLARKR